MEFKLIDLDEERIRHLIKSYILSLIYSWCLVVGFLSLILSLIIFYGSNGIQIGTFEKIVMCLIPLVLIFLLMCVVLFFQYRKLCSLYFNSSVEISNSHFIVRDGNRVRNLKISKVNVIQSFQIYNFKNKKGDAEKYNAIFLILKRSMGLFSNSVLIRIEPSNTVEKFIEELQVYIPVKIKRNMW